MTQEHKSNTNNFWFGYALGMISGSAAIYLLGTKKGRETLKTVIQHTENYEGGLEDILNIIKEHHSLTLQNEAKQVTEPTQKSR